MLVGNASTASSQGKLQPLCPVPPPPSSSTTSSTGPNPRRPVTTISDVSARCHLRVLAAIEMEHDLTLEKTVQRSQLQRNAVQVATLENEEKLARQDIEWACLEIYHRETAHRRRVEDLQSHQATRQAVSQALIVARFSKAEERLALEDARREEYYKKEGLRLLAEERDREKQLQQRIEERRRQMKADMQSITAAIAFVKGEQQRQRDAMNQEMEKWFLNFYASELAGRDDARRLALERHERDLLEKVRNAQQELDQANQAIQQKKDADFRREQNKLRNRCTHGPRGTSVFSGGQYGKRMCLLCKVKVDGVTGHLVRM